MKSKFGAVATALLALVLCGTAILSYAQQEPPGPPEGRGFGGPGRAHFGFMFKELGLTDTQKQQIKAMVQTQRASMKTVGQQLAQNRLAMLQATANGNFDQAKVQALAVQRAQLEVQMTVQHEALQHQVYTQVLTPEQRAKADQLRADEITRINERLQKMSQQQTATPEQ